MAEVGRSWQNLAEFGNVVEFGRMRQCGRIWQNLAMWQNLVVLVSPEIPTRIGQNRSQPVFAS